MPSPYDMLPLVAYVRGVAKETGALHLPESLTDTPLDALTETDLAALCAAGKAAGLKLYRFKHTHSDLPRVRRVLGFLRGISFDSLLDVGSGRGVFLFPFLSAFPWVSVTAADILDYRVAFLNTLTRGGMERLSAVQADICTQPFGENCFDVVTLLEVLEHIPDVAAAIAAAVRIARQFVIVSVPSKPDDNPEHIHLLTKEKLTALFYAAGCTALSFDGVNGHLIAIARTGD